LIFAWGGCRAELAFEAGFCKSLKGKEKMGENIFQTFVGDRLAERSEKGLDRGKSAVKYRVFIGFFADSISDLESFRAFRLNMYLARNG